MHPLSKVTLLTTLVIPALFSCNKGQIEIKALILPKFEIGELSGDEVGEAQYLYEEYFLNKSNVEVFTLANNKKLYVNKDNHVALGVTGMGKTNSSNYISTFLSDTRFNISNTYFVAVGCAGSSMGYAIPGDVAIIYETVDYDLGHSVDYRDLTEKSIDAINWYHDSSYDDSTYFALNEELCNKCYLLTKDIVCESSKENKDMLELNYPGEAWANRDPKVIIGTAVSSDSYWKGTTIHNITNYICKNVYKCKYEYAMTEMEDVAISNVLNQHKKLDKLIDIRASVNLDVFIKGSTPERLWRDKDPEDPTNKLNIFEPAMRNMSKVTKVIVDNIISNKF